MTELVAAVRSTGAEQPILLGGVDWSRDLTQWLAHVPSDPLQALVASNHTYDYATCYGKCRAALTEIARGYPIVSGEIGEGTAPTATSTLTCAGRTAMGSPISPGRGRRGGWTCKGGPTLITDYDGTPTPFGIGFRDHLRALFKG